MRWSRLVCPRLRDPAATAGRPRASGDGAAAEPEEGDDSLHLRPAAASSSSTDKNNGERDGRDPTYQEHEDGGEGGEYVELREITTRADARMTTDDAADAAAAATRRPRLRSSTLPAVG
eukprot:g11638.t1